MKIIKRISYRKVYNEGAREEGEVVFVGDKYDLAKVTEIDSYINVILKYFQHSGVETFRIDQQGVFKIKKNQRRKDGVRIQSYGDEKIVKTQRTQAGLQVSLITDTETERVTAHNWKVWVESRHQFKREGPIFLSYTRTRGDVTVTELREELETLVRDGIIR